MSESSRKKSWRPYRTEVDPSRYNIVRDDTGDLKYSCSRCGNLYKWKKSVNKHWKEKHEEYVEQEEESDVVHRMSLLLKNRRVLVPRPTPTHSSNSSEMKSSRTAPSPNVTSTDLHLYENNNIPEQSLSPVGLSISSDGVVEKPGRGGPVRSQLSNTSNKKTAVSISSCQISPQYDAPPNVTVRYHSPPKTSDDLGAKSSTQTPNIHPQATAEKGYYACAACQKSFQTNTALNDHFIQNHHERIFDPIDNAVSRKRAVTASNSGASNANVFKFHEYTPETWALKDYLKRIHCPYCDYQSNSPNEMSTHITRHNDTTKKSFTCMVCGYQYRWRWDLIRHFDKVHQPVPNPYRKKDALNALLFQEYTEEIDLAGNKVESHASDFEKMVNRAMTDLQHSMDKTGKMDSDYPTQSRKSPGKEIVPSSLSNNEATKPDEQTFCITSYTSDILDASHMKRFKCPRCSHKSRRKWDVVKHMRHCGDGSADPSRVIDENFCFSITKPTSGGVPPNVNATELHDSFTSYNHNEIQDEPLDLSAQSTSYAQKSWYPLPSASGAKLGFKRMHPDIKADTKRTTIEYHASGDDFNADCCGVDYESNSQTGYLNNNFLKATKTESSEDMNFTSHNQSTHSICCGRSVCSTPGSESDGSNDVSDLLQELTRTIGRRCSGSESPTEESDSSMSDEQDWSLEDSQLLILNNNDDDDGLLAGSERSFNCPECSAILCSPLSLKIHISKRHMSPVSEKVFMCANCQYRSKWKCDLKKHCTAYSHKPLIPFDRKLNKDLLKARAAKDKHDSALNTKPAHSDSFTPFKCGKCPFVTATQFVFNAHQRIHEEENSDGKTRLHCELCPFSTSDFAGLQKHIKHIHGRSANDYKVLRSIIDNDSDQTSKNSTETKSKMSENLELQQTPSSEYSCNNCGEICSSRASLRKHRCKLSKYMYETTDKELLAQDAHKQQSPASEPDNDKRKSNIDVLTEIESLRSEGEKFEVIMPASPESSLTKNQMHIQENAFSSDSVKKQNEGGKQTTTYTRPGVRTCPNCPYVTPSARNFQKHVRHHYSNGNFRCFKCDWTVDRFNLLLRHMKTVHHIDMPSQEQALSLQESKEHDSERRYTLTPINLISAEENTDSRKSAENQYVELKSEKSALVSPEASVKNSDIEAPEERSKMSSIAPHHVAIKSRRLKFHNVEFSRRLLEKQSRRSKCCPKCGLLCINFTMFKKHTAMHGAKRKYICKLCDYSLDRLNLLLQHIRGVHKVLDVQQVHQMYTDTTNGSEGVERPKGKTIRTENGEMKLIRIKGTVLYTTTDPTVTIYRCPNCPYTSTNVSNAISHARHHGAQGSFTCQFCDYSLNNQHLVEHHIQQVHLGLSSKTDELTPRYMVNEKSKSIGNTLTRQSHGHVVEQHCEMLNAGTNPQAMDLSVSLVTKPKSQKNRNFNYDHFRRKSAEMLKRKSTFSEADGANKMGNHFAQNEADNSDEVQYSNESELVQLKTAPMFQNSPGFGHFKLAVSKRSKPNVEDKTSPQWRSPTEMKDMMHVINFQQQQQQQKTSYACDRCSFTTAYNAVLIRHKQRHEMKLQWEFNCPHCSYAAPQAALLQLHVNVEHGDNNS